MMRARWCGRSHHRLIPSTHHRSSHRRDYFDFEVDRRREGGDLDRGASGLVGREVLGVDAVVGLPVVLHVGQEADDVDDVVPLGAGLFEDEADVLEAGLHLGFDVVGGDVAGCVERHARNVLLSSSPWTHAGKEQEITDASCVRVRADGFGGFGGVDSSHWDLGDDGVMGS